MELSLIKGGRISRKSSNTFILRGMLYIAGDTMDIPHVSIYGN